MKRTHSITELAAEYNRNERALRRHLHKEDDALWNAAYDGCTKAHSRLLRSKPATCEEAAVLLHFVKRELMSRAHHGAHREAMKLRQPLAALRKGRHEYTTWSQIDLVVQWLSRLASQAKQLQPLRRALRSVCAFIEARGGRPDPRQLRVLRLA